VVKGSFEKELMSIDGERKFDQNVLVLAINLGLNMTN
jgi:hypothetical protein